MTGDALGASAREPADEHAARHQRVPVRAVCRLPLVDRSCCVHDP